MPSIEFEKMKYKVFSHTLKFFLIWCKEEMEEEDKENWAIVRSAYLANCQSILEHKICKFGKNQPSGFRDMRD